MQDTRNRLLTWIEVDLLALEHNLALLRALLPDRTRLLLVVKANAYGHGLGLVTRFAGRFGVDCLGVHSLHEAAGVRAAGWTGPVLIMGYVAHSRLADAMELGAGMTVFDRETVQRLARLGRSMARPAQCHLKLETGTQRHGIAPEDLPRWLERFSGEPGLRLAGLSTHFANIEDTTDHSFAKEQLRLFNECGAMVRAAGHTDALFHTACSAAVLTLPETSLDMARVGISAYGLWPSRETLVSAKERHGERLNLKPALSWKTRIAQIKDVRAGAFVGYGCSHRTGRRTRLAVLPVGYSDGYDRGLSGLGHVLIRGRRAPVMGRVCMNLLMTDVTDIPGAKLEEEVVLIGRQGSEEIKASDLASAAQTIPYEIVSRLGGHIPRFALDSAGMIADVENAPSA